MTLYIMIYIGRTKPIEIVGELENTQSPEACEQAAKVSPRIEYKLSLCCIVLPLTLMFRSMRGRGRFRNLHMYLIVSCHVSSPSPLPPSLPRSLSLSLSGTTSTVPHGEEARNRQAEAPYIVVYEFTLLFSITLYTLYTEPEMLNNDIAKMSRRFKRSITKRTPTTSPWQRTM
jgi:hypothetical protein